jgi:hypothetical protein
MRGGTISGQERLTRSLQHKATVYRESHPTSGFELSRLYTPQDSQT